MGDNDQRRRGRRSNRRGLTVFVAGLLALSVVAAASGGQRGAEIDPAWLSERLGDQRKPADVRNNVLTGKMAKRDAAVAQWRKATRRHQLALRRARGLSGKRRAAAVRAARRVAPDPGAKPEYVVVWASNSNASDMSGQTARDDLTRALGNPIAAPSDHQDRFVPGADGFAVIDARRRNLDGKPNGDYGKVVNFVQLPLPWGVETEAHHMQYQWEPGQPILAGGLFNDTTFVLGVKDLPNLELLNTITPQDTPNGTVPDAYDYAGGGRFIGTYMGGPQANYAGSPGEVVTFTPDAEKGVVVGAETPAGSPGGRHSGNAGGIPEPCSANEAAPLDTCANPHGVQVRPDLGRMVTSDYAEPKMVVLDPVKADGGRFFRPTVRVWDTTNPDTPKLLSVAHMSRGWRPPNRDNGMKENRGIMENAKTWPKTPSFPQTLESKGFFAGAMCGGGIFFTPDVTKLKGDSTRQFSQVFDDGIALMSARGGSVDQFMENGGPCEGGAWMQVSRNNKTLYRVVSGAAPNPENNTNRGQGVKVVYNLDVSALIKSAQDGKVTCDLSRGMDTDGDGRIDVTSREAVRAVAEGRKLADCPRLVDTLTVDDSTSGGPHWGAIDNHSLASDGTPTRLVISNYFVARSGVDGNHRMYMVDVDPRTQQLSHDTTWRDENTGNLGVDFNRRDWPGAPGAGFYKPHSMVWVCPPGVCAADSPGNGVPAPEPPGDPSVPQEQFSGDCQMTGTSYFQRPYTLSQDYNGWESFGDGTCTGELGGKAYDGPAHLYIDGRMNQPMSCEFGAPVEFPATITFGDPQSATATRIDIVLEVGVRPVSVLAFDFRGAFNGNGVGVQQFAGDQATFEQCAAEGIESLDFTVELHTATPIRG